MFLNPDVFYHYLECDVGVEGQCDDGKYCGYGGDNCNGDYCKDLKCSKYQSVFMAFKTPFSITFLFSNFYDFIFKIFSTKPNA